MGFVAHMRETMQKERHALQTASVVVFGVGTVAIPLFFLPITRDPLLLPKELLLHVLVLCILFLWLLPITVTKQVTVRHSLVDIPLFLLVVGIGISAVFSVLPSRSFLGDTTHFVLHGTVLFACIAWFWLFVQQVRTPGAWQKLVNILVLPGLVSGVLFLFARVSVQFDIFSQFSLLSPVSNTGSTFGIFMVLIGIVSWGLFFVKGSGVWQTILSGVTGVVATAALMTLGFTIAWIIFAIGSGLLLVVGMASMHHVRVPHFLFLGALFFLTLFFIIAGTPDIIKKNLPVEVALGARSSWEITTAAVGESAKTFLFGTGPGTFVYDFSLYRTPYFNVSRIAQMIRFHEPYSTMFAFLAEFGVVNVLIFLFLFLLAAGILFRAWLEWKPSLIERTTFFLQHGIIESQFQSARLCVFVIGCAWLAASAALFLTYADLVLFWLWWWLFAAFVAGASFIVPTVVRERKFFFTRSPQYALAISFGMLCLYSLIAVAVIFDVRFFLAEMSQTRATRTAHLDGALLESDEAIQYRPGFAPYYTSRAMLYLGLAKKELEQAAPDPGVAGNAVAAAIDAARTATELQPKSVEAWETLATMYINARGFTSDANEEALRALERAIALEPSNPVFYWQRGAVYASLDRSEEAIRSYERAIELKPDYVAAYMGLSHMHESNGDISQAIETFAPLGQIIDQTPEVLYTLGFLFYNRNEQGDRQKAEAAWIQAVALQPNYSNALYSLGTLYESRGDVAQALSYFERVLALHPNNADVRAKVDALK